MVEEAYLIRLPQLSGKPSSEVFNKGRFCPSGDIKQFWRHLYFHQKVVAIACILWAEGTAGWYPEIHSRDYKELHSLKMSTVLQIKNLGELHMSHLELPFFWPRSLKLAVYCKRILCHGAHNTFMQWLLSQRPMDWLKAVQKTHEIICKFCSHVRFFKHGFKIKNLLEACPQDSYIF